MALKLSVGVSKKVGQPNYGSLGAQCHLEYDLDVTLLVQDLEQFHQRVRQAYQACARAVDEELERHRRGLPGTPPASAPSGTAGTGAPGGNAAAASGDSPAAGSDPEDEAAGPQVASGASGPPSPPRGHGGHGGHGGNGGNGAGSGPARTARGRRAATPAQQQALKRLAERQSLDLKPLLAEVFDVQACDQLSVADASQLIGWLQARPVPMAAEGALNRHDRAN